MWHSDGPLQLFPLGRWQALRFLEIQNHGAQVPLADEQFLSELSSLTNLKTLQLGLLRVESSAFPKALPTSLQHVELNLYDSNNGIPEAIEACTNLQSLSLRVPGKGAKLSRPLSPFLAMLGLTKLHFRPSFGLCGNIDWEPQALRFLGQALVDIQESGKPLCFMFH